MGFPAHRIDLADVTPEMYRHLASIDAAARHEGLERPLVELVKMRASQLNKCAFCLDMHSRDALAADEDPMRLHVLPAWREADCYSDRERAALALTEEMTDLVHGDVTDETWKAAEAVFETDELAGLMWLIIAINAWNRIGVGTRLEPGHYRPAGH